jgi:NAD(P)-dependent dehydrogenase (short-subunit alcohol dehydrogenase family)
MRMNGRVALITGAGSGIGRATALLFAREGAQVGLLDVEREGLEASERLLRDEKLAGRVFCVDVRDEAGVEKATRDLEFSLGKLDAVANVAGISWTEDITKTTREQWDRVIDTNLRGVFHVCKHAIPAMLRAGGGSIVNIASILAIVGDPVQPTYCASKGGIAAMTRALAIAYGPKNIRANTICPGDVNTPMLSTWVDEQPDPAGTWEKIRTSYPIGRIAEPQDIAYAALFLASDESRCVSGTTLVVDGGFTVRCY